MTEVRPGLLVGMSLIAITREVSRSLNECELSFHPRQPIDLEKAIAQHKAYQDCLAELGAQVISLPAEPELPDAVFVEDTALVLDELAIIARMGALSRRGETTSIAEAVAHYRPLNFLKEPATLDGGDVLRVNRTIFVGLSRRTNTEAIEQLRELLGKYGYEVRALEVKGCLHLRSACSYIGNNTVLIHRPWIHANALREFELLDVAWDESGAANALFLNDVIIIPASFPKTSALLAERGYVVRALEVSELQKAEAGVTCCSLIFRSGARL
jgi:dimethylargininase